MNFVLPSYYGETELTGKQQNVSKGLDVVGQGLTQFFNWKTAQAGSQIQPAQSGSYYTPQPPPPPNYTPLIVTSVLLGTLVIGGIVYMNTKGKKK